MLKSTLKLESILDNNLPNMILPPLKMEPNLLRCTFGITVDLRKSK